MLEAEILSLFKPLRFHFFIFVFMEQLLSISHIISLSSQNIVDLSFLIYLDANKNLSNYLNYFSIIYPT